MVLSVSWASSTVVVKTNRVEKLISGGAIFKDATAYGVGAVLQAISLTKVHFEKWLE